MEVKPESVRFSYKINKRLVLLELFTSQGPDFMWIYVGGSRYAQCCGDITTTPMEMWPLAVLSALCQHKPETLECAEILALRDHLLAQPGALRAGS